MTEKRPSEEKAQPWRILVPDDSCQEEVRDVCQLTDRPWARQKLADAYSDILHDERQYRYPGYDKYRQPDPFRDIYKAESAPVLGPDRLVGTGEEKNLNAKELADYLRRAGGKD